MYGSVTQDSPPISSSLDESLLAPPSPSDHSTPLLQEHPVSSSHPSLPQISSTLASSVSSSHPSLPQISPTLTSSVSSSVSSSGPPLLASLVSSSGPTQTQISTLVSSPPALASSSGPTLSQISPTLASSVSSSHPTLPQISPTLASPIVNPLVSAGLIPEDLSDILAAPPEDAAISKKRTKRITGARALTADDYSEMLLEEKKEKRRG